MRSNDKISMWRKNAGLSKTEFSENYGIPVSLVESWEDGTSTLAPWIENLIIDKLMQSTDEAARKKAELILNMLVPIAKEESFICSWAIIKASPYEEQITFFDSLGEAVETYYKEDPTAWEVYDVTYTICTQTSNGDLVSSYMHDGLSYLYRDCIELS